VNVLAACVYATVLSWVPGIIFQVFLTGIIFQDFLAGFLTGFISRNDVTLQVILVGIVHYYIVNVLAAHMVNT
jgi:hypothetical protein